MFIKFFKHALLGMNTLDFGSQLKIKVIYTVRRASKTKTHVLT